MGIIFLSCFCSNLNAGKVGVCSTAASQTLMRRDALGLARLPLMVALAAPISASPTAVEALVPQPEILAQALLDVDAALSLLDSPAAGASQTAAARAQQLLQRSLPEVGEAAAATYARQRGPTIFMFLQWAQGQEPKQTLSPVDLERLAALEGLTEDALAGARVLAAANTISDKYTSLPSSESKSSELQVLRKQVRRNIQQLLCELRCVAVRSQDYGSWAGCAVDQDIPGCKGVSGVNEPPLARRN